MAFLSSSLSLPPPPSLSQGTLACRTEGWGGHLMIADKICLNGEFSHGNITMDQLSNGLPPYPVLLKAVCAHARTSTHAPSLCVSVLSTCAHAPKCTSETDVRRDSHTAFYIHTSFLSCLQGRRAAKMDDIRKQRGREGMNGVRKRLRSWLRLSNPCGRKGNVSFFGWQTFAVVARSGLYLPASN